jgi:hypothetical protein
VLRVAGYRFFFFFSREELRPCIHVEHANGQAEFWLEPDTAFRLIQEHENEIRAAWEGHFGR